jgi:hypothetical protein
MMKVFMLIVFTNLCIMAVLSYAAVTFWEHSNYLTAFALMWMYLHAVEGHLKTIYRRWKLFKFDRSYKEQTGV